MTPPLARRHAALAALGSDAFDVLIIGGGINGAGIARDAAMRGLRAAVVERSDFAAGTSSRSSKLIHGGLRYLQQGHVRLVLEAVRERERMRRLAPHLVRPQEFVVPLYRGGPVGYWTLAAGLWGYDLLAGFWSVKRHRMLRPRALAEAEPTLRREGLKGAGLYWDYRTDDARLVLETAMAAAREGAVVLSYAAVTGFVKEDGRIVGARVADVLGGDETVVRARVVVNATGPWVDRIMALDEPGPPRLRLTKGVHVVVPRAKIGNRAAFVLNAVQDGRVMFVIPWGEHALVGTTDTDHAGGPDTPPTVEASDVKYLLDTVNYYFPAAALTPADVVSAFAGLRPLIGPPPGSTMSPSDVSREEEIFVSASGLVSIAGGKLTTYRLIAESVVDRVVERLRAGGDQRRIGRSRTGEVPLPGGTAAPATLTAAAISRDGHGLAPATIEHLAQRYGSRLDEVLGLVARDQRLGERLLPTLPEPRAEVVEAVEHEWAMTLDDVLRRRTQVALRDDSGGSAAAAEVAALMAPALGWDAEHARAAVERYVEATRAERRWR
jgi:glycerol-3-phosphate dehydrogenase